MSNFKMIGSNLIDVDDISFVESWKDRPDSINTMPAGQGWGIYVSFKQGWSKSLYHVSIDDLRKVIEE